MRNKILLLIAVLLSLLVLSVRYIFKNQFAEFEISIRKHESVQLTEFQQEKEKLAAKSSNG